MQWADDHLQCMVSCSTVHSAEGSPFASKHPASQHKMARTTHQVALPVFSSKPAKLSPAMDSEASEIFQANTNLVWHVNDSTRQLSILEGKGREAGGQAG